MNANVIVWDLETVPDLRGFAAANGLPDKSVNTIVFVRTLAELRAAGLVLLRT